MTAITGIVSDAPDTVVCSNVYRFNRSVHTPHMEVVGMYVVSFRGVNFGFWSHLGCSGQNAIISSREGLV